MRVLVLVISDRACANVYQDLCFPNLKKQLQENFKNLDIISQIVPDDYKQIQEKLLYFSTIDACDVILTTGGTGFSSRDITPEATKGLIDKETPGLNVLMLIESLKITPYAALSRPCCGILKQTLIINLPGSPKGACENFATLIPILPHALQQIGHKSNLVASTNIPSPLHLMTNCDCGSVNPKEYSRSSKYEMFTEDMALLVIFNSIKPTRKSLNLSLLTNNCSTYFSFRDVYAAHDIPERPTSTKDGYAMRSKELFVDKKYKVCYTVEQLKNEANVHNEGYVGTVLKISTGDIVPSDCDTIIPVENTLLIEEGRDDEEGTIREKIIQIKNLPVLPCQDIRPVGNDLKKDDLILGIGQRISPQIIALLASTGTTEFEVYNKPRIVIFSTGDEIINPYTVKDKLNQVRDSNRFMLKELLHQLNFNKDKLHDLGIIKDNPIDLLNTFTEAIMKYEADIVITTGGVSMGHKDYTKSVIQQLSSQCEGITQSNIHFGRVNLKPGMPTTFSTVVYNDKDNSAETIISNQNFMEKTQPEVNSYGAPRSNLVERSNDTMHKTVPIFSLPGNPVSAYVMFHILVLPALHKMAGDRNYRRCLTRLNAILTENIPLDSRPEYKRGILDDELAHLCYQEFISDHYLPASTFNSSLLPRVKTTSINQMSSNIFSLASANCFIKCPPASELRKMLHKNDIVEVVLL